MARREGVPHRLAGRFFTVSLVALLLICAGPARAGTGGAVSPAGQPTRSASPSGAPAGEPSAGALTLLEAKTTPRKSFYFGVHFPKLRYVIGSSQPQNDLRIDVVNAGGEVVRTFYRNDVAPGAVNGVRWDGATAAGRPARPGRYRFRVSAQAGSPAGRAATSSAGQRLGFSFYAYMFPLLGEHELDEAGGRFGAGRAGHTHQGQDVMAQCGTPVVAARGGRVQYAGYEGNAGNYLVIDGKGTGLDFMYAHLMQPSPLRTGDPVRTGQLIGYVGRTGDATACHLHFEMWTAPGWYEGGSPFDPLPYLQKWDRYS